LGDSLRRSSRLTITFSVSYTAAFADIAEPLTHRKL
jgi:hypothetical protein